MRRLLIIPLILIVLGFTGIAEGAEQTYPTYLKSGGLSPLPLMKILSKEETLRNKEIYVVSLKFLKGTNEIALAYFDSYCLITVIYKAGDENKRVGILQQYDVVIPRKEIRTYYKETAPRAEVLLKALDEIVQRTEGTIETKQETKKTEEERGQLK